MKTLQSALGLGISLMLALATGAGAQEKKIDARADTKAYSATNSDGQAKADSKAESKGETVLDMAEFAQDWQVSKEFTLEVANAMPAESYDYKPNPEERTFGEQMIHIAVTNVFRFQQISGVQPPFAVDFRKMPTADKATALKLLEQSFDYVISVLPQISSEALHRTWHTEWKGRPDPDGRAMILGMFVHTAHHRAQCEVYLRAKRIRPPEYAF